MLKKKILIKGDYVFTRNQINNDLDNPLCSGCSYYVVFGYKLGRYGIGKCKLEDKERNICEILTPKYYNGSIRYIVEKKR
jgi:hypothetical protein